MTALETISQSYQLTAKQQLINQYQFHARIGVPFNPEWHFKQDYLYHIDRFNYIHLSELEVGNTPIFITLTLPSEYHQFKKVGNAHFPNSLYAGHTVEDGYKRLLDIFRTLYNKHSRVINGKRVTTSYKYVRVIEPHKDFTPHLHAVVYVSDPESFKSHFDRTIKNHSLEQVDYEQLSNASHSLAYLLKYVSKTIEGSNQIIMGWKKTHKIIQVRTSNMPFNKVEYQTFKSNVKFDKKYSNYFIQMKEELEVHRHVAFSNNGFENCLFSKSDKLSYYIDSMTCKVVSYSESPKYIYHSYSLNTETKEYFEVCYESDREFIYSNLQMYDDMFDLPILKEVEDGLFIPETYFYVSESIEDDTYDYLSSSSKKSSVLLHSQFHEIA